MYSNDCDFIDCYDVDPSDLTHTNDYLEEQKCYKALWGAVILQAIVDATSDYKRTEYRIEKRIAASWLLEKNPDFITVCHLSCYDPKYIREKQNTSLKSITGSSARNVKKVTPTGFEPVLPP